MKKETREYYEELLVPIIYEIAPLSKALFSNSCHVRENPEHFFRNIASSVGQSAEKLMEVLLEQKYETNSRLHKTGEPMFGTVLHRGYHTKVVCVHFDDGMAHVYERPAGEARPVRYA